MPDNDSTDMPTAPAVPAVPAVPADLKHFTRASFFTYSFGHAAEYTLAPAMLGGGYFGLYAGAVIGTIPVFFLTLGDTGSYDASKATVGSIGALAAGAISGTAGLFAWPFKAMKTYTMRKPRYDMPEFLPKLAHMLRHYYAQADHTNLIITEEEDRQTLDALFQAVCSRYETEKASSSRSSKALFEQLKAPDIVELLKLRAITQYLLKPEYNGKRLFNIIVTQVEQWYDQHTLGQKNDEGAPLRNVVNM